MYGRGLIKSELLPTGENHWRGLWHHQGSENPAEQLKVLVKTQSLGLLTRKKLFKINVSSQGADSQGGHLNPGTCVLTFPFRVGTLDLDGGVAALSGWEGPLILSGRLQLWHQGPQSQRWFIFQFPRLQSNIYKVPWAGERHTLPSPEKSLWCYKEPSPVRNCSLIFVGKLNVMQTHEHLTLALDGRFCTWPASGLRRGCFPLK